jgi:hypothetical protein
MKPSSLALPTCTLALVRLHEFVFCLMPSVKGKIIVSYWTFLQEMVEARAKLPLEVAEKWEDLTGA